MKNTELIENFENYLAMNVDGAYRILDFLYEKYQDKDLKVAMDLLADDSPHMLNKDSRAIFEEIRGQETTNGNDVEPSQEVANLLGWVY